MITDRQLSILNAIVEDYVELGHPIGSKSLIERHEVNVSPATIRNEMKKLEEMQLIEKAHLSSGRLPSTLGFRYYVDHLLSNASHQRTKRINNTINDLLVKNNYDITSALGDFADELSRASSYTALVTQPDHNEDKISNMHVFKVNDNLLIMVVVFNSGNVEHVHLPVDSVIDNDTLIRISNFVAHHLNIGTQRDLLEHVQAFTQDMDQQRFILQMYDAMQAQLDALSTKVFMGGKVKLINALNESNVSSIQPILHYIESNKITDFLSDLSDSDLNVKIGDEIDCGLDAISIVTSQYHFDDTLKGRIAIIGPTAMHYQNVIQLMRHIW